MAAAVSVEEALRSVLAHTPQLETQAVALADAVGRILAADVSSDLDLPPFERAMMDGYAVRAADAAAVPVRLQVDGLAPAGSRWEASVASGHAVQITTGAPLPAGADAVQQLERTRALGDGFVEILAPLTAGQNVASRGSEVAAGARVLAAGERIDAALVAVLATVGQARVQVGRRPRVAVVVTGDELVDVESTPTSGQIRNSNGPTLLALVAAAGGEAYSLGVAGDVAAAIREKVRAGLSADVLVLSGGVSAGVLDLVEPVLEELGVEKLFDRVAVKPGAPLVFGRHGATLVFGLPGNPVSAQVTFELFVRPALLRMQGARSVTRPALEVELTSALANRSGRRAHLPVRVQVADGRLIAEPLRSQGSADVVAHARANALAVLEAGRTHAAAGERVPAVPLGSFPECRGG